MSVRAKLSAIPILIAAVLVIPTGPTFGQIGTKKKHAVAPCIIRPDPGIRSPLGVGFPAVGCGVNPPAPAIATIRNPIGGGRSLGFGSLFGSTSCPPRLFAPRSTCFVPPAPVYFDRPNFWYPSSNLGHCTSSSFYSSTQVVNVAPIREAPPPYPSQPATFFDDRGSGPSTPIYGFRSTATPRAKVDRGVTSAISEFYKPQPPGEPVAVPQATRSPAEIKQIEAVLDSGDAQFRKGDYQAAREHYTRALVLAGEDPGVRIPFGLAEFALGRFSDAARAMRQAVSRPPLLDPATIDLRRAYGKPADFENHLRALESFIGRNPFDADALFLLGFLKACTGNPIGARAVFDKYVALRDADPAVRPFIDRVARADR